MQNKGYPLRGSFFVRVKGYAVIVYSSYLWENKQLRKEINAYFLKNFCYLVKVLTCTKCL